MTKWSIWCYGVAVGNPDRRCLIGRLAFTLNEGVIHFREHSTCDSSSAYAARFEAKLSKRWRISFPLATGVHSAAVCYRGLHFSRLVDSQEVGDAIIERIAIFVLVLQGAREVSLMYFAQEFGHF